MKLSRSVIIVIGFSGLLLGGGVLFAQWTSKPVTTTKSSTPQSEVLSSKITLKPFETTYFKTLIPDTFVVKTQAENPRASVMGNYLFKDSNVAISDQLGITIGKLNGDTIDTISAAKLRQTKPDEYQKVTLPFMPNGAIAYQRIDGYETAVFWAKDTHYITAVMSGSIQRKPQLDQALQAVLSNWQ